VSRQACALLAAGMLLLPFAARGAVYQWSVEVKGGRESAGPSRAFLWIPPDCRQVRGVVLAQHNMQEESILENPRFRKALGELGFAEIWCAPAFDHLFRFNEGAGDSFNGMMRDLAAESGYAELEYVPIAGIGHSAAASWPYYFAAWAPQRTLAALSVSGQWPYFRSPIFAPDIWGARTIDFIPCLESMGEYESAEGWANEGLHEREQHPLLPLSMVANPAQGHFAATDRKVDYLALYLKKAVQYRMPRDTPGGAAPKLIPIDPTRTGWLVDRWRLNKPPTAPPAPVNEYTGDPKQAFWFFDEELARATVAYEAAYQGLKVELLGYQQNGQVAPQTNSHQQVNLKFMPMEDGVSFQVTGVFLDAVPGGSPRPAGWTGLPAGSPVGHASGGGPISIDRITGPFEKTGPDTFAVHMVRGLGANLKSYELWFAASHPGGDGYRPALQQAEMIIPARNNSGAGQHITFPEIPAQAAGTSAIRLNATSDSGMKVSYYVLAGPAEVEGDTLKFTPVPPGARFPVPVTVVAWQYGRAAAPAVKTAEPVERTFSLVK
jgi:hypothetical protein